MTKKNRKKSDEEMSLALATFGGLLAALVVLLIGTATEMRAWILLLKAAMTFLLVSAIVRFVSTTSLLLIRSKSRAPEGAKNPSKDVAETAGAIATAARSTDS